MKELDNSFTDIIHCYTHTPIINTALSDYLPTGFYDLHQYRLGFCVLLRAGMLCSSHTQNGHGSLKEKLDTYEITGLFWTYVQKSKDNTERQESKERKADRNWEYFFPCLFIIDAYIIPAVVRIGLTAKLIFRSYKQALYDWIIWYLSLIQVI